MAWLKDECSRGRPEHCNAITATLLFELTVDLCSWNNHFGDVRGHTVDGVTTVLEQVRLMSLPNVNHTKTTVCTAVNTYAQIHIPSRQTKFRHVWNCAKAKPATRMGHKRVFFEFEQFRQGRIQSHGDGD
ncbi:hypothetical protein PSYTB_28915 (plasmid) [Pseudomonas amygdali pv. tabaci str. ATCC 11528]|uniref:Uncharacterized protein n=2 Tax=Pseudomonas syringae TaxID=317 RepID=A0A1S6YAW9_PSESY|nr:hypothetical protein [Pseudomonas syringae pv. syringae]AQX41986.1 hypothetical protein [Pseudomonas syringae pv. syringae]ATV21136.1 hypothetical protein CT122_31425 [Pseudomonas syringae pv. actinidiae]QED87651.1 hypothetical protein PSYTB_28915 [Pseudomonas amygdali pv. tabaci str. ATCC 11528]